MCDSYLAVVSWLKQLDFGLGQGKTGERVMLFYSIILKKKKTPKQNNNHIKPEMVVSLKIGSAMECAFKELNA